MRRIILLATACLALAPDGSATLKEFAPYDPTGGPGGGDTGDGGGSDGLPPPMSTGAIEAGLQAASADNATVVPGEAYQIGVNAAIDSLWEAGYPVAHQTLNGEERSGTPVFYRPPFEVCADAVQAAFLEWGLGTSTPDEVSAFADSLLSQGFADGPSVGPTDGEGPQS